MRNENQASIVFLGVCLLLGLSSLGYILGKSALQYKAYERTVTVKGLSEREYDADTVVWPIEFTAASNDLEKLYESLDSGTARIRQYLLAQGISANEISVSTPAITDKSALQYSGDNPVEFRYTATHIVTVYSQNIAVVRTAMASLSGLGKQGIVISVTYSSPTEYLFTRLNDVKPDMVEEATRNAREVAMKFADDSQSTLGKIKNASQGQFSIEERNKNDPHMKTVRVVSTLVYYLSD